MAVMVAGKALQAGKTRPIFLYYILFGKNKKARHQRDLLAVAMSRN